MSRLFFVLAVIVAVAFLLLTALEAPAQCHSHGRVVARHHAPTYAVNHVAVRKVAVNHHRGHAVAVKRVVAFDVPQYYYGVSDAHQQNLIADAAAFRAFQALMRMNQSYQQALPQQYQSVAPAQPDCPTCQQPDNGGGIANQIQVIPQVAQPVQGNWQTQLSGVVQQACAKCHAGGNISGGVDLSNLQNVPFESRVDCYRSVSKGKMPKGHPKLSAAQVALFRAWVQSK